MLTPQEVSSHAFPKAVVGGYNMASVDEFLDELTDDYSALYKENAALKAKMKVLVEKVEDYRATEDSMRATLLTAQKMADSIVREAEGKRDQLLARAESDARAKIGALHQELTEAQTRLQAGQKALAEFVVGARDACTRELAYLDQLPTLTVDAAPAASSAQTPAQDEGKPAVGEIEKKIFARYGADAPAPDAPDAVPAEDAAPAESPDAAEKSDPQPDYPEGNPFDGPRAEARDDDPTRRINLRDLKFGRNYSGASDEDDD